MTEAGVVALAYLIGSIPMAYVLGRVTKRIDIRSYGSGNAGASNVWVHLGKRFALPLGAFDIFVKGAFPVYLARELGTGPWVTAMAGLATVAGHNWSLYLKLTGGRGVTVALGVLLVLTWKALAVFLLVAIGGGLIFRSRRPVGGNCHGVDSGIERSVRGARIRYSAVRRNGIRSGCQTGDVQPRVSSAGGPVAKGVLQASPVR